MWWHLQHLSDGMMNRIASLTQLSQTDRILLCSRCLTYVFFLFWSNFAYHKMIKRHCCSCLICMINDKKTLLFLSYLYERDLHCACWCPASMDSRPSADTVLITQIDSVLIRSQYRYVLWKTLWFLSYLFECDLHWACWCPASVDARPSADTVLVTQFG